MFDLVALGELLIDFTEAGLSGSGMRLFEQNPGGAVANVLAALAKFGHNTAFIRKVGQDIHGRFLQETLEQAGINTQGLIMDVDVFTTMAFVALSPSGERTFSFARKPGADICLTTDELDMALLQNTRIFHIGSLSLTDEPVRSATLEAIRLATAAGAVISYDPNYRASLWKSRAIAQAQMRSILPFVDLMKLSSEEAVLLTGSDDPKEAACILQEQGVSCVVVTLGASGALVNTKGSTVVVPGHAVTVLDTTGAGDAFWGGFCMNFYVVEKCRRR